MGARAEAQVLGGVGAARVEPLGLVEPARVAVGGGPARDDGRSGRHHGSVQVGFLGGDAGEADDAERGVQPQDLLHGALDELRVVDDRLVALALRQEHGRHDGDHVGGGLVAGQQQRAYGGDELLVAEPPVLAVGDLGELAEQVVARVGAPFVDESGDVGVEVPVGLLHLRLAVAGQREHDLRPVGELVLVLARRSDERADDPYRQGQPEPGRQVGRGAPLDHLVHELVGHGLHAGPPRLHPLDGEGAAQQPPPAHVPLPLPQVRALTGPREDAAVLRGGHARGVASAPAEARVGEHGAHVVVAGEQAGGVAAGQPHVRHRAAGLQLGPLLRRLQRGGSVERVVRQAVAHRPSIVDMSINFKALALVKPEPRRIRASGDRRGTSPPMCA